MRVRDLALNSVTIFILGVHCPTYMVTLIYKRELNFIFRAYLKTYCLESSCTDRLSYLTFTDTDCVIETAEMTLVLLPYQWSFISEPWSLSPLDSLDFLVLRFYDYIHACVTWLYLSSFVFAFQVLIVCSRHRIFLIWWFLRIPMYTSSPLKIPKYISSSPILGINRRSWYSIFSYKMAVSCETQIFRLGIFKVHWSSQRSAANLENYSEWQLMSTVYFA